MGKTAELPCEMPDLGSSLTGQIRADRTHAESLLTMTAGARHRREKHEREQKAGTLHHISGDTETPTGRHTDKRVADGAEQQAGRQPPASTCSLEQSETPVLAEHETTAACDGILRNQSVLVLSCYMNFLLQPL